MARPTRNTIIRKIRALHARRAPLNISAVKRQHPELIEKVYVVRPFWGWKQALEDAGLDYSKINLELRDYVDCKICGRDCSILTTHLLYKHELTPQDYLREHPGAEIMSETVRAERSVTSRRGREGVVLPHWELLWTPEYVLDRMAELHRRNFPMNFIWISKLEQPLTEKAKFFFRSWDEALRRIDLDPAKVRRARPAKSLSRKEVIAGLRQRRREGLPLNSNAVAEADWHLSNAARLRFGGYEEALLAAGIDPALVRKASVYTPETITDFLAEASRIAGLSREEHFRAWPSFRHQFQALANTSRFGGWKGVCAEIGMPRRRLFRKRFPDRAQVIAVLRQRFVHGKSLTSTEIFHEDGALYAAVLKHVGKFETVYRRFGIQPPGKSAWWGANKVAIRAEIRRRHTAGEPLSWNKLLLTASGRGLLKRSKTLFGSWSRALIAAGLNPSGGARSPWPKADPAAILAELRRRKRAGESLRSREIEREKWGQALRQRAKALFGSWKAARLAAGVELEPRQRRSRNYNT